MMQYNVAGRDNCGDEFIAEDIRGERAFRGKTMFHVKWQEYDSDHNTWELEDHITPKIIQMYKAKNTLMKLSEQKKAIQRSDSCSSMTLMNDAQSMSQTLIKNFNGQSVTESFHNNNSDQTNGSNKKQRISPSGQSDISSSSTVTDCTHMEPIHNTPSSFCTMPSPDFSEAQNASVLRMDKNTNENPTNRRHSSTLTSTNFSPHIVTPTKKFTAEKNSSSSDNLKVTQESPLLLSPSSLHHHTMSSSNRDAALVCAPNFFRKKLSPVRPRTVVAVSKQPSLGAARDVMLATSSSRRINPPKCDYYYYAFIELIMRRLLPETSAAKSESLSPKNSSSKPPLQPQPASAPSPPIRPLEIAEVDNVDDSENDNQSVDNESTSEPEYIVEKIMKQRRVKGKREYLTKWLDYPHSENTWEPEKHLAHCTSLLDEFWSKSGKKKK